MSNKERAFVPHFKTQLKRLGQNGNINYNITNITETTLHFLEGAPLNYKRFEKWILEEQMKPDKSVHFMN